MGNTITVDNAIKLLNEFYKIDPNAMDALVKARVPCNDDLANHPTVQVGVKPDGGYQVGILGILNGLFGTDDRDIGFIAGDFEAYCPNGCEMPEQSLKGTCPICNSPYKLGKLLGFRKLS